MAKVTVNEVKPVAPKLESVTLEMSPEEALVVLTLLGRVNPELYGMKYSSPRQGTYTALHDALKLNYGAGDPYDLNPLLKKFREVTEATGISLIKAKETSRRLGFWRHN